MTLPTQEGKLDKEKGSGKNMSKEVDTLEAKVLTLMEDKTILERRMLLGADFLVEFLNKYMVLYHANRNLFTVAECDEFEADLAVLCQKFGITLGKQEE